MNNTKTYTFTEAQLRLVFKEAAKRRDEEIMRENPGCDNAWVMRVSTWYEFADDTVKRLIASVQPQDGSETAEQEEDVWARRAKEDAELSNDQDEDARLAAGAEKKETEDEKEPPKVAGYISSRSVDKLQFNIDTVKLGNLPGCYKMVKEEGGFFKALSDSWNVGEWVENEPSMEGDDTPCSFLNDMHCCSDTFWVNPKYAHIKAVNLGEIGCREVAMDGITAVSIAVYYIKNDGTVIAYDLNVC